MTLSMAVAISCSASKTTSRSRRQSNCTEKHLELDLEDLKYRCHETSESLPTAESMNDHTFLTKIPPDFAQAGMAVDQGYWLLTTGYTAS